MKKICETCGGRKVTGDGDYVLCLDCLGTGYQTHRRLRVLREPGRGKIMLIIMVLLLLTALVSSGQIKFKMLFMMLLLSFWSGIFFACVRVSRFFSFVARKFNRTPSKA